MAIRRLIISDLHFGFGDDLLSSAAALELIEPELAWAEEVVINGDLLELVFASLEQAVSAARPFLRLVNRRVGRVHYVLGNYDHHLVSLAGDERRFCELLGTPDPAPFRVAPAERLLRALCPDIDVVSWYLTGAVARPERLEVADYEGLIAPLYELMYEIANLPSGRCAQQRVERWLDGAAAIVRAPQRASRRLVGLAHTFADQGDARGLLAGDAPTGQVLEAMQAVCRNLAQMLAIQPAPRRHQRARPKLAAAPR